MTLWRLLASTGLAALVVAGLAFVGTLTAAVPARWPAADPLTVAYVSFFLGAFLLGGAAIVRTASQVNRTLRLARSTE